MLPKTPPWQSAAKWSGIRKYPLGRVVGNLGGPVFGTKGRRFFDAVISHIGSYLPRLERTARRARSLGSRLPLLVGRYTRRFGFPQTRQQVLLDSLRLYEG